MCHSTLSLGDLLSLRNFLRRLFTTSSGPILLRYTRECRSNTTLADLRRTPRHATIRTIFFFFFSRYMSDGVDIDVKFGGTAGVENLRKWVRSQRSQELERMEAERHRVPGSPPGRPLSEVRRTELCLLKMRSLEPPPANMSCHFFVCHLCLRAPFQNGG